MSGPPPTPSSAPDPRERVAVIVVHGVGDQQPMASARAISDLLQNIDVGAPIGGPAGPPCSASPGPVEPRYRPFTETSVRVNVRPVVVRRDTEVDSGDVRGPFHAWVHEQRQSPEPPRADEKPGGYDDRVAFRFMRGQLACYLGEGPENTYETIRLEGTRTAYGAAGERNVHVYEVYWADLSRLQASVFTIFAELFQLIFHLPSLGTHVVDAEALHHPGVSWGWLRRFQSWAAVCLTVPIPIVNVFMLAVAAVAAGLMSFEKLPLGIQAEAAISVVAAVGVAAAGLLLWRDRNKSTLKWTLPVLAWVAIAVLAWWVIGERCGGYEWQRGDGRCEPLTRIVPILASAVLAAVAGGLAALAINMYDRRRPGANTWAFWLAAFLFPDALASLLWAGLPDPGGVEPGVVVNVPVFFWFRMLESLYISVMVAWGVFVVLAIAAWVAGEWAMANLNAPADADSAARGRWTGRLMLSIPSFAFIVIALAGWGLIAMGLEGLLPGPVAYRAALNIFPTSTVQELLDNLWRYGGGSALGVLLVVGLLAALPAIWGLAPVAWTEVVPPAFRQSRRPGYTERLGEWLTVTFRGLRLSGRILYVTTTFVVPAVVLVILLTWLLTDPASDMASTGRAMRAFLSDFTVLGSISGAVIAWLFAMRGQIKKAALGFRPVLDVMLDVDNWLREHPLDDNPTARICGRYVSLLRYICNWRDPLDPARGYDAIVIVAHSQGTVISADLLRFLKHEAGASLKAYDPELEPLQRIPVRLFTMGCPLRDLYGLRFPRLYGWARHQDPAPMATWAKDDLVTGPRSAAGPAPEELLGVTLWDNAYRSGDYVGRFLWRTIPCGYLWTSDLGGMPVSAVTQSVSSDGVIRMEFCIGAGAHTHYWDRTAPTIGAEIDRLIAL